MEILLYENRKVDPICWDASTPEKKEYALLCLFQHFDKDWEFYTGMEDYPKELDEAERKLKALGLVELPEDHVLYADHIERKMKLEKLLPELKKGVEQYGELLKARKGDVRAAGRLMYARRNYECEWFQFVKCIDPLKEKK